MKTASFELSKKLVEAGLVLETESYWIIYDGAGPMIAEHLTGSDYFIPSCGEVWQLEPGECEMWSAPDVIELLRALPRYIKWDHNITGLSISPFRVIKGWSVGYYDERYYDDGVEDAEELPDALAQLLLWCKENNYLEVR